MKMLHGICALALGASMVGCGGADARAPSTVSASHGGNEIRLHSEPLAYEVLRHGKTVVAKTPISLTLDGVRHGDEKLLSTSERTLAGTVSTPVYKKASVDLAGRETYADFGAFGVRLVARADGVAYRFETKGAATVDDESAPLTIPTADAQCWFNRTEQVACEETVPEIARAGALETDPKLWYYLPFVYSVGGTMVAVTESNIHDYPAVNYKEVRKSADGVFLSSHLARHPKSIQRLAGNADIKVATGGRWIHVTEEYPYLAKLPGAAELPWRTFILADAPEKLCEADIVYALARPQSDISDFKWVKPGKVQWEWWSAFDNQGDPQGCTTATYLRFIDFAAQNGVEYVIMDEGWSEKLNIWKYNQNVDVPRIIDYANKKGVGIILWMAWAQVYGDEEKVAAYFSKLGAKGFKVDFMDRGDADMTVFLEKFAAACARHKMVIDYHGAYRPVGLQRTYPNILNYEGIHGLERMKTCKADKDMTYNDVMCFFLRMTAGPMDYTPGAMLNYKIGAYGGNWTFPGSVGTRVHQMAQLVLYEAPLQMLCDSPTNYGKNMECFTFMAKTPTVWDATVGLPGTPETVAAVARKAKDGSWYAAAITNKDARDYALETSFLGSGAWVAEIFRDTADGGEFPRKYVHETKCVKAGETLKFRLAEGGGFVVRFAPESADAQPRDGSFNIATFNIRVKTEYDTDERYWGVRMPYVIRIMRECGFDVMGVQECTPDQAQDLEVALKKDWARVGGGKDVHSAGESNSIFFRRARFELIASETFALSDTPDVIGSMTWGNRHPRVCTVVKLYDKCTGKVFHYFNTHLDHECGAMNVKGMNLILSKVKALLAKGEACFLSGDMNAHPDSEPIKLARTVMNDTFDVPETPHKGPDVTFNWFGWKGRAAHRIDFMFATPNVRVLEHETVIKRYDGVLPSDHEPVVAKVVLSGGPASATNDASFAADFWPKTPSPLSRCWFIRAGKDMAVNACALGADDKRAPTTPFVYTADGRTIAVRGAGDDKQSQKFVIVDDPSRLCEHKRARVALTGGGDVMRFFLGATAGDAADVTPAHRRAREVLFDETTPWAETIGLPGNPETVAAIARRAADGSWRFAAVTDGAARVYEVPSEILGGGEWTGEVFYDSADGKLVHETWTFPSAPWKKLVFPLAKGGGFVTHFRKKTP